MAKHFAAVCHAKPQVEFPQITETSYSYMVILSEVSVLEMKNKKILFAQQESDPKVYGFRPSRPTQQHPAHAECPGTPGDMVQHHPALLPFQHRMAFT